MTVSSMPGLPHKKIRSAARSAMRAAGVDPNTPLPIPLPDIAAAAGLQRELLFNIADEPDLPPTLRGFLSKMRGRLLGALAIPEKRIYVDTSQTSARARFTEAHEIGHDALPWHRGAYMVDDIHSLAPDTKAELEAEANAFAAEVLFGLERFARQADDYRPSLQVPLGLTQEWGTSAQATVRRYAETSRHEVALVLTGVRPIGVASRTQLPIWSTFESPAFVQRYGRIGPVLGRKLTDLVYPSLSGLMSERATETEPCDVTVETLARGKVKFSAQGFTNGRVGMVLIRRRKLDLRRQVHLVGPDGLPIR